MAAKRALGCGASFVSSLRRISRDAGDGELLGRLGRRRPGLVGDLPPPLAWRRFASGMHRWSESAPRAGHSVRLAPISRAVGANSSVVSELGRASTSGESGTGAAGAWRNGLLGIAAFYGKCYFELSKARLSAFVVSTAAVGFVMGSGEAVDWAGMAWTSVGTMLTAASANSFNQILEVANDGRMKRTMRRPLPSGRMSVLHALGFAVTAGVAGVTVLASQTTELAAELGALNIVLYTLVYTPLKQIHSVNTWVGAVVGAIPPLMGWAAAAGEVDRGGLVLAAGLYFWQIPHFMSLAFLCREDYARGGYKMLSLLDKSGQRTALCALRNCLYLLPLGFLAQHWGTTSGIFGAENLALTAGMGATSALFYFRPSVETARRLFRVSLLYLPIFMTAMVVHRNPNLSSQSQRLTAAGSVELEEVRELAHSASGGAASGDAEEQFRTTPRSRSLKPLAQPPISFVSAAPFPFLPAPDYY